ncbi:MAG: DUF4238 domain-containing protein [Candidatus Thorarchaeota archaeon]
MHRKDRQHFVSRSYLRNFSPDLDMYLREKDAWDFKKKKKFKDKMKIHFFDIKERFYSYRYIYSLAKVDRYLLPTVDRIVRQTENKLSFLKEIIKNKSEEFLYENNNQKTLWEIANCLKSMSKVFREAAETFTSTQEGKLITKDGNVFATLTYTDFAAEFYQSYLFTNDPKILMPLFIKSVRFREASEDTNDTFEKIFEAEGLIEELNNDMEEGKIERLPEQTTIPSNVYPILIENNTNLPFITGDECVPKTAFILPDLTTRIYYHFFPLNPDVAIILLDEQREKKYFQRRITRRDQVHRWNRLIYDCSSNYLFAKSEETLRETINEPERSPTELI